LQTKGARGRKLAGLRVCIIVEAEQLHPSDGTLQVTLETPPGVPSSLRMLLTQY
jgi:hypothetical protein